VKQLRDRVAVVTGAASGIGRALAGRFAAEGMKLSLADVDAPGLEKAAAELEAQGASVLAVPTDVAQAEAVDALARRTREAFGAVHVVCNNAGVGGTGALTWERSLEDWRWALGVNLWSVIHGIRSFVPILLEQGGEGHIVNTASIAGMLSGPGTSDYCVTKHAVVTLSESLHHELALTGAKLKVSVLCPGWVDTRILESARRRAPADAAPASSSLPGGEALFEHVSKLLREGLKPAQVADAVVRAIHEERFYIFTHPEFMERVRTRMDDILGARNPGLTLLV
jgi:NAD(P)-dependent dehydrogenase (short-subunit alcohol dehydrogenase family)